MMEYGEYSIKIWDENFTQDFFEKTGVKLDKFLENIANETYSSNILLYIPEWGNFSDLDILSSINFNVLNDKDLYIINDLSFLERKIFNISLQNLDSFVADFFVNFGECFFNGDIYFIAHNIKKIVFFSHNGIVSLIDFSAHSNMTQSDV